MLVKCNSIYAGPYGSGNPGQIIELPDKSAKELIASGNGTAVNTEGSKVKSEPKESEPKEIETATVKPKETQESPKRKKGK